MTDHSVNLATIEVLRTTADLISRIEKINENNEFCLEMEISLLRAAIQSAQSAYRLMQSSTKLLIDAVNIIVISPEELLRVDAESARLISEAEMLYGSALASPLVRFEIDAVESRIGAGDVARLTARMEDCNKAFMVHKDENPRQQSSLEHFDEIESSIYTLIWLFDDLEDSGKQAELPTEGFL